jgi:hypothetical protein
LAEFSQFYFTPSNNNTFKWLTIFNLYWLAQALLLMGHELKDKTNKKATKKG